MAPFFIIPICLPLGKWILLVSFVSMPSMGFLYCVLPLPSLRSGKSGTDPIFCFILFFPTLPYSHGSLFPAWKIHLPTCFWPRYLVDVHKSSFLLPFLVILPDFSFRFGLLVIHSKKHYPASHFLKANYLFECRGKERGKYM